MTKLIKDFSNMSDSEYKQHIKDKTAEINKEARERHLKEVYRTKNSWKHWGYRGKDFDIKSDDGLQVLKCHQSVSGTLYIYDKNMCLHKVTEATLNQMEAEMRKLESTELPRLNSVGPIQDQSPQTNPTQSETEQK